MLVDEDVIVSLREMLGDRFPELVSTFETDAQRRLTLIENALSDGHFTVIISEVHGLKGSFRNIGCDVTATLCDQIEERSRNKTRDNLASLITALQQDIAAIAAKLKEYI